MDIIIIAVLAFFALLALAGFVANRRRAAANEEHFKAELLRSNRDLAAAHAADNGWDPERLHDAARTAFAEERGGTVTHLELVQVIDPPGKDEDKAVFRVASDGVEHTLTLGRRGDSWHFESVG